MTIKEIIDGLKFTVAMFLFDSSTGETFTEPRNDMDKITIDACIAAIELLEKKPRWIPVSERLHEADVIGGLNMTDQISNEAYKQIMIAAQDENEVGAVLDKLRAELHATAEMHDDGDYYLRDEWIDEILDKYKAESEE